VRRRQQNGVAHLRLREGDWRNIRGTPARGRQASHSARRSRQRRLGFEALENRCLLSGTLLVSEFVADNNTGLRDGYGKNSDWIELYNASDATILLRDYYLTDNSRNLDKWRFPDITLAPHSHLVVFASGKGEEYPQGYVQDPAGYWHTNFKLEKSGEYLAVTWRDPSTGALYVQHEYAPVYPQQLQDISYGLTYLDTGARLIELGDNAKLLVPTDNSLGSAWISPSFSDVDWALSGPLGAGYELLVAPPVSGSGLFYGPYGPQGTWNLYEVVTTPRTWIDAHYDALSRQRGGVAGHLVTISSISENQFIQSICGGLSNDPWIGLTDSDTFAALGAREYGNTSSWPLPPVGTPPSSTQRGCSSDGTADSRTTLAPAKTACSCRVPAVFGATTAAAKACRPVCIVRISSNTNWACPTEPSLPSSKSFPPRRLPASTRRSNCCGAGRARPSQPAW